MSSWCDFVTRTHVNCKDEVILPWKNDVHVMWMYDIGDLNKKQNKTTGFQYFLKCILHYRN